MKKLIVKPVLRFSKRDKLFRIFRVVYNKGNVGDGKGYSAKVSLALMPVLVGFRKELFGFTLCFLGFRLHHKKAYGGYFT